MSTITTLNINDDGETSRTILNSNFSNLNTDKLEATDIPALIADKVTGPVSSIDNAVVRFDSTTGKLVQNSGLILNDVVSKNAILDLSLLATTDKTFTLPNETGTIAIKGGAARFSINSAQSITSGSPIKVQFSTEEFDVLNEYDNSNYKFTCASAGRYLASMQLGFSDTGLTPVFNGLYVYRNGVEVKRVEALKTQYDYYELTVLLNCNAGDYIEFYVQQTTGSPKTIINDAGVSWGHVVKIP